jgi:hypothetical protein
VPSSFFYKRLASNFFPYVVRGAEKVMDIGIKDGWRSWKIKVKEVSKELLQKGELERDPTHYWKLTKRGEERIRKEVSGKLYQSTLEEVKEEISRKETKEWLIKESKTPGLHVKVEEKIEELGRILGKFTKKEYREGLYTYDVVWKEDEKLPRISHVFEIQHKGNLEAALVKLKHAYDNWRSYLFLIVIDEKDREKIKKELSPLFASSFHEISNATIILSLEDLDKLYESICRFGPIIARLAAR